MNLQKLLQGKIALVMTDAKIKVPLSIKTVTEESHSQDTGPATQENDWWPPSRRWKTIDIVFENGFKKSYDSLNDIELQD